MKLHHSQLLLYAVTDRAAAGGRTLEEAVEAALQGGVTAVQFREKRMDEDALLRQATQLRILCHRYGVPLIVNDYVEIAEKSGADGVHVGIEDTPVAAIRRRVGHSLMIGATVKTPEQAVLAEESGADYLGVGAVFPSPTKPNAVRITVDRLRQICSAAAIPAVAIGGITPDNIPLLQGGGMAGIAVVSALFGADDIRARAILLRQRALAVVAGGGKGSGMP